MKKESRMLGNPNKPHAAVLTIKTHVYEKLDTGELSGVPIPAHTKEVRFSKDGDNLKHCVELLEKQIEEIKKWSRT